MVPECYGPSFGQLPDGPRVVVFNQGAYHTFDLLGYEQTEAGAPYAGASRLAAVLTVSDDSAALLRYAFPSIPVHVARVVVDRNVFHPGPRPPGRRIAYLTHRRPGEREQLRHLLRARGVLDGWTLAPIAGRTERQTAAIMRDSAVFLSFSQLDGFGLPPAEAMACGSYVVGYPGQGGREYFDPAYCAPVPDGDLLAYARAVEQAIADHDHDRDPAGFGGRGRLASQRVLDRYSADGLRADLLAFYEPLLARTATGTTGGHGA